AKSQLYTRAQSKFGLLTASFDLTVLLVFWFAGGFNRLDLLVRGMGFGAVGAGLLYVGIILFLKTLVSMPFSIYSTFVLEDKFGFNKTTPKLFVLDFCKGLLLAVLLGTPLLGGIFYLFEWEVVL
ncbi:MAG: hypothetical protein L3J12_04055, partial [Spirochaetales bacterium]|nr:hypothetical protein [Spirochaetales bacterium]